nr:uncharacterized protein LOC129275835 [Lytechinus pictus]
MIALMKQITFHFLHHFFSRLIELTTRHRQETEIETERLRTAQLQAERTLEARERAHRQRVKGLEEQNSTLKDQMQREVKKRQQYISMSSKTNDEIQDLRNMLSESLHSVSRDPTLDPVLLEHETRKLDESMGYSSAMRLSARGASPPTSLSPRLAKDRTRSISPVRLGKPTSTSTPGIDSKLRSSGSRTQSARGLSPSSLRGSLRK